uniref:Phospholipase B-like n=1 Tax=Macrostomum lignano TaxID=282301 RepID=A0A1I8JS31_9PLAT
MAPRAKIFRREAPRVFDAAGMAAVLRFNEFADDPYSRRRRVQQHLLPERPETGWKRRRTIGLLGLKVHRSGHGQVHD